jgi:hypothetical protein
MPMQKQKSTVLIPQAYLLCVCGRMYVCMYVCMCILYVYVNVCTNVCVVKL